MKRIILSSILGLPFCFAVIYVFVWFSSWVFLGPVIIPIFWSRGADLPLLWTFSAYNAPALALLYLFGHSGPLLFGALDDFDIDTALVAGVIQLSVIVGMTLILETGVRIL